jgi:hypothetical protein
MADTPFGLSFGNPSMYMGKSPIADIGKALKTGLMVGALEKSGARAYLDSLGVKPTTSGQFGYELPKTGIAPPNPITSAPGMSPDGVFGSTPMVAQPMSVGQDPMAQTPATSINGPGVTVTPLPDFAPAEDAGQQILDGSYKPPVSFNNMDFNPSAQQTGYNTMLATGNEYQQVPGYGKLKKAAQMFGMG